MLVLCQQPGGVRGVLTEIAIAAVLGISLDATSGSEALEEIIVTATKRAAPLQKVALSVGVLDGDELEAAGYERLEDFWRTVASLSSTPGFSGGERVSIRGLTDSDNPQAPESLIAFYHDDSPITHIPGLTQTPSEPTLIDVARVEVLRGPQGTHVGANAMGGAVRVITREPELLRFESLVRTEASSTTHGGTGYRIDAVLNQPVATGTSAFRLAAFYHDTPGYIDDIGQERPNGNWEDAYGARLSFKSNATDSLEVLARVQGEKRDIGGLDFQDPTGVPEFGFITNPPYQVANLVDDFRKEDIALASLRLTKTFENGELVSLSSWFERDVDVVGDAHRELSGAFGFIFPAGFGVRSNQVDWVQEIRFSQSSEALEWLLGLYYLHQDGDRRERAFPPEPDESFSDVLNLTNREDIAIFGDIHYPLSEEWTATAGARWYDIEQSLQTSGRGFFGPVDGAVAGQSNGATGKLSLSWSPSEDLMVYGLVSMGFRPGQLNPADRVQDCRVPAIIDEDSLVNYELGSKLTFAAGRVNVNATLFHIDWSDIQINLQTQECFLGFFENAGDARSRGLEIDLRASLNSFLTIQGSLGYNDSELTEDNPELNAIAGRQLPNVPKLTASGSVTFDYSLTEGIQGFSRIDLQYVDSRISYFDVNEPVARPLSDYSLLNLRTGIAWQNWRVEVFLDNALDEYVETLCCRDAGFNEETFLGRPRTGGIRATLRFQ